MIPPPVRAARALLAAGAAIALSLAAACGRSAPPSFVVVVIDTLRPEYLGCYGFEGPVSPAVDRIAGESFLFERCYAQAPWTKPSVASLLCSLYPSGHGVTNHEGRLWGGGSDAQVKGVLADDAVTLPEVLRDGGYATAAVVANPWITREYGFAQGFETHLDVSAEAGSERKTDATAVVERARAWLRERPADRPFFLYLHFMDVHGPYDAPDSCFRAVVTSPSIQTDERVTPDDLKLIPFYLRAPDWVVDATASWLTTWRGHYAAGMRRLDDRLGPFLEELRADGTLDHTWLVITSDHGEELHEHGGWDHGGSLYEYQIHVPLIVRPPGGLRATRRVGDIVRLIDVMPTILGRAGLEAPPDVDGADLGPLLDGRAMELPGVSFATAVKTEPGWTSLNVGRYKLILNMPQNRFLLFDLDADPAEKGENLAASRPRLAKELLEHMRQFVEAQEGRSLFHAGANPLSAEELERLRSLGYVN